MMRFTKAESGSGLAFERVSRLKDSLPGTCEDISCLERIVVGLLLKNQHLRFKLLEAQDRTKQCDPKQQGDGTL